VTLLLAPIPWRPHQAVFPINVAPLWRPMLHPWEALHPPVPKRLLQREERVPSAAPLIRYVGCDAGLDLCLLMPRRMPHHPEFQSITRSNL
jgi:hypothetical protein